MTPVLLAAVALGIGLTFVAVALLPAPPDLRAAVTRLADPVPADAGAGSAGAGGVARARIDARVQGWSRLARYRTDLAITGTSPTRLAAEKAAYALVGLLFPCLMGAILVIAGLPVPVALPALASLGLAVAMSFLPEHELKRRAELARVTMRRTVCAYLELVAMERAADAGAVEALERASTIGHGLGFEHIRDSLLRARLEGRTPWRQLGELADEVSVPELGDVADIMRLSGEDGAAVLPTLRARAASLRTSLLQADVAAANRASERMAIPVALLGVAFMALLGFPAFHRILFG